MTENLPSRRCVVFGAGGFIGTNLCNGLNRASCEVLAVSRSFTDVGHATVPKRLRLALSAENLHLVDLEGATDVFYLAGPMGTDLQSGRTDFLQSEIFILEHILAKLASNPSCRFIYFSSGGTVYGQAARLPTPEDSPLKGLDDYSRLKIASEQLILDYVRRKGLKAAILRVANPYGPFQTSHKSKGLVSRLIACALLGEEAEIVGGGTQLRDFIYIDDVVSTCLTLLKHDLSGQIFNVGSGTGRTVREVITAVEACCGRRIAVRTVPGHVAIQRSVLDSGRLSAVTGWSCLTDFQSGLIATKVWWETNIQMLTRSSSEHPAMGSGMLGVTVRQC